MTETVKATSNFSKLESVVKLVANKKFNADKASELFHAAYSTGEITRMEFHDLYDMMEKNLHHFLKDKELANVLKRMDNRTLGEFALKIYDNTLRERILAEAWLNAVKDRGLVKTMKLKDHGMDNRGTIVFSLDKINHQSDFIAVTTGSKIAIPDGEHPLEMKYCPTDYRLHFKAQDLTAYAKSKSYALIIMGKRSMVGSNGDPTQEYQMDVSDLNLCSWGILTPECIRVMLETLPVCRYDGYMGNKPCIRVCKDADRSHPSYSEFMEIQNW